MDVSTLIKVLKKRWWILVFIPLVCAILAFSFKHLGEKEYQSEAKISTGITVNDDINGAAKYFNPYEISVAFNNLIQNLRSRHIINLLSYDLLLHDIGKEGEYRIIEDEADLIKVVSFLENENLIELLTNKRNNQEVLNSSNEADKAISEIFKIYDYDFEHLSEHLTVRRISGSDFIQIQFISENPRLSAFVVNRLSQIYIRHDNDQRKNKSDVSLESLAQLVANKKEELQVKMEQLKNYKSSNGLLDSDIESESKIRQIQDYESQISAQDQEYKANHLSLSKVEQQLKQNEVIEQENEQLVELRTLVNRLNERYITGDSQDKVLYDSIQSLRDNIQIKLAKVRRAARDPLDKNDLLKERTRLEVAIQISESNLNVLNSKLTSLKYSISDFANKEANISTLENEVEITKEEYTSAQENYSSAHDRIAVSGVNLTQVMQGEPALKPESSKTMIYTVFGGALGFFMSLFGILLLEYSDVRIKSPIRFKKEVKLPLAGFIVNMTKTFDIVDFIAEEETIHDNLDELNHSLRKIRFEIENLEGKVMLFTSTKDDVGKSFIVMALSKSLSMMKKKVLIIDTNLRNNTLTELLVAGQGLKKLLSSFSKNSEVKLLESGNNETQTYFDDDIIKKTYNQYIDIIGCKTTQMTPGEVLSDIDFEVIIDWLRVNYDYIFLEGASLNSFSDSKELIKYIDHIIPIFSARENLTQEDKESVKYLKTLGPKLGPAILNQVELEDLVA
jgi:uncharacterized protein involved in exopolysaccharide biosynthesis/Mrp family chromosome partitioning ATPase